MSILLSILALVWLALLSRPARWVVSAVRPEGGGSVSILVSARNEEFRVLRPALESMLSQEYPIEELIVVDDRSTDNTLSLLRSIPGVRVVEGSALPGGWQGKPHGMAQAAELARGDWILATDADIIFHPQAVGSALELCRRNGWDVLSLWPRIDCLSLWERVVMPVDLAVTACLFPLDRVNGSEHRDAFAIGGFILMRRSALQAIGGFRAVRQDVADDFALGVLFKKAGLRLWVGFAPELLSTRDYAGLGQLWEGLTRKLFSNLTYIPMVRAFRARFRGMDAWRRRHRQTFVAVIGTAAVTAGIGGLGLALLPALGMPWAPLPGMAGYLLGCYIHRQYGRLCGVPARYSLLAPLGYALYAAILLVAAGRVLLGRGLVWKGRRIY